MKIRVKVNKIWKLKIVIWEKLNYRLKNWYKIKKGVKDWERVKLRLKSVMGLKLKNGNKLKWIENEVKCVKWIKKN